MIKLDEAKKRLTAFWEGEAAERCLVGLWTCTPSKLDTEADHNKRWFDMDYRYARFIADIERTSFGGEYLPNAFMNFGPGVAAAFLGSSYVADEHTVWFDRDPLIKEWSQLEELSFDRSTPMWRLVSEHTRFFASSSNGRYYTSITDLGGTLDIAAALRGSEALLFDLMDNPDEVHRLIKLIDDAWIKMYSALREEVVTYQQGTTTWLPLWCPSDYYILQCDFSAMLSPAQFEQFVLPSLELQCKQLSHSIYHLDGKDAVRHLDMLLSIDKLDAVQWVPGAGAADATDLCWLPLYKKIQSAGKGIFISCEDGKRAQKLMRELSPDRIFLHIPCKNEQEMNEILGSVPHWGTRV